jgi:hypothetical protein
MRTWHNFSQVCAKLNPIYHESFQEFLSDTQLGPYSSSSSMQVDLTHGREGEGAIFGQ